jgi:hypothetical protein
LVQYELKQNEIDLSEIFNIAFEFFFYLQWFHVHKMLFLSPLDFCFKEIIFHASPSWQIQQTFRPLIFEDPEL